MILELYMPGSFQRLWEFSLKLAVHWEFVWVSLNIEHPKTSWIIIFIDFHSFSPFKVPFWGYTAIPILQTWPCGKKTLALWAQWPRPKGASTKKRFSGPQGSPGQSTQWARGSSKSSNEMVEGNENAEWSEIDQNVDKDLDRKSSPGDGHALFGQSGRLRCPGSVCTACAAQHCLSRTTSPREPLYLESWWK